MSGETQREYRVTWEIDVDAGSPVEAVRIVQMILTDRIRGGNVYEVREHGQKETVLVWEDIRTGHVEEFDPEVHD